MRDLGLEGARRGKKIRTTIRDDGQERAADLLRRDFTASSPNERWVADFTYVATWSQVVYVAFVVDVFSRTTVGWSAATSKRAKLVLDALDTGPMAARSGWNSRWADTGSPFRCGQSVHIFRVHRAPCRRRHQRLDRHHRRRPGQRAHAIPDRPPQDGVDQAQQAPARPGGR